MSAVFGIKRAQLTQTQWWSGGEFWYRPFVSDQERQEFMTFISQNGNYRDRRGDHSCETDPSFLQIIPYGFFIDLSGQVLIYTRGGTKYKENRLTGKVSVGLGGHIDETDPDALSALEREISEEADIVSAGKIVEPENLTNFHQWLKQYLIIKPLGLLMDDRNDGMGSVGQVHIGLICQLMPQQPTVSLQVKLGAEGVSQQNMTLAELKQMVAAGSLVPETWTQLLIDLVFPQLIGWNWPFYFRVLVGYISFCAHIR